VNEIVSTISGRQGTEKMAHTLALSESLKSIMDTLGMTPQELARTVGASDKTVARWLADETYPQHGSREKLGELEELTKLLLDTFDGSDAIAGWIRSESGYLGRLRPIDALTSGRIDRAAAAIQSVLWGIYI
jgi:hypothetical protein